MLNRTKSKNFNGRNMLGVITSEWEFGMPYELASKRHVNNNFKQAIIPL